MRAVIAESFERIHRSNLVGMGILPLEFPEGESAASLGLSGHEVFALKGLAAGLAGDFQKAMAVTVEARTAEGDILEFEATARLDTPQEGEYFRHGGILQFVLRQLQRES